MERDRYLSVGASFLNGGPSWGVARDGDGKTVWAELGELATTDAEPDCDELGNLDARTAGVEALGLDPGVSGLDHTLAVSQPEAP